MKLSNYTFDLCLPEEGQVLIYNSLSNNLAVLETDEYAQLIECKKGTMNIYNPELLNELIRGGFLIEDNVDELKTIRLSSKGKISNRSSFYNNRTNIRLQLFLHILL